MKAKLMGLVLVALIACGSRAEATGKADPRDALPARVAAEVVAVVDGDTFRAKALVWPDVAVAVSVRLRGVDTPELRGRCKREKARARKARDFVRGLLPAGTRVLLSEVARDKYAGRVDARVTLADGRDLAKLLLERGLGRAYDGGRRAGWCG